MRDFIVDFVGWLGSAAAVLAVVTLSVAAVIIYFDKNPDKVIGAVIGPIIGVLAALIWTAFYWGWIG